MSTKSKNNLAKKIMFGLMTTCVMSSWITVAYALPTDGSVVSGTANITTAGDTMSIKQSTDKAIINWGTFNILTGETVNFLQPNVSSSTLNRVAASGGLSTIAGKMNANGSIILINPNGLIFSQGSVVNAAGIVVSTADITNENYLAGKMIFDQSSTNNNNIKIYGALNAETNGDYIKTLNIGGIKPATELSVLNNKIMLVADGDIILGDQSSDVDAQLTAVTTTTVDTSQTVGQEDFDVADTSSVAVGKIVIRADQNADDQGTVILNNTNRNNIKSHTVDIYYNPELTGNKHSDGSAEKNYTKEINYQDKIAASFAAKINGKDGKNITDPNNTSKAVALGSHMLVNSMDQLQSIDNGTYGNMSGNYAQGKSLAAGNYAFRTLGDNGTAFSGSFSGHGGTATYSINNLTMNKNAQDNIGLFANVTGAISDVHLEAANITGKNNVGGIAGTLSGTITGTTVTGTITGTSNVGGLVGASTGNISWSSNSATVKGVTNTGGIIGDMTNGTVSSSNNLGTITGTTDTGGIAGKMSSTGTIPTTVITTTYNFGKITGNDNTGGIVGEMLDGKLDKVYNTNEATKLGTVITNPNDIATKSTYGQITGVTNTGGLVGNMKGGIIDTAYNAGNITATGENTGGLIGNMSSGKVEHAYNADNNTVLDTTGKDLNKYYGFTYNGTAYNYEVKTDANGKVINVNTHPEWDDPTKNTYIPFKDRVYNIRLAYRDANVTGTSNVGGVVGNITGGTINQVYNAGKVTSTNTSNTSNTTGGIAGIATGGTVTDSFFVTTDKGVNNTNNISGLNNAFGTGTTIDQTGATAKTLFAAQTAGNKVIDGLTVNGVTWNDGKTTISDKTNQNNDWIVYNGQTTPLLKGFMDWIDINRVYEYNGETRNLVTNDIDNYYGGAFFNKNDGSGKNVHTEGYANADQTKYPGSSEYHYDESSMWSPQHGYQTTASSSLIITPKDLKVDVSGSHVYGEKPLTDYYLSQDGKNYSISFDGTNYKLTETFDINGKYKLTFDGFVTGENYDKALTGLLQNTTYKGENFQHEKDQQQLGAGTQSFTGTNMQDSFTANNGNYKITYGGKLEVKKANLNFTADGNREYGDNNTGVVSGDEFVFKATDVAQNLEESAINDGKLKAWDKDNAGDISKLAGFKKTDGTAGFELYYTDANGQKVKITNVTDVKIDGDKVVGYSLADGSFQKANGSGEYQLTTQNYNMVFKSGNDSTIPDSTYTINKADLNYIVDNKDKIYGDENPNFTGSFSGFKNDDNENKLGLNNDLKLASTAHKGSNAGDYVINASGKTNLNNYNVTYKNGTLTIKKADLVYNVNDSSKEYGDKNPIFTGSIDPDSLKNGDKLEDLIGIYHQTNASDWSDVGEYEIAAGGNLTNYNVTYVGGKLTIRPTQFYYKALPSEYLYNQTIGSQIGRIVDKNGRDVTDFITGTANFTTSAVAGSPVGQYAILGSNIADNKNFTMAGQLDSNYTALTIKNGSIIVRTDPVYESAANFNATVKNQFGNGEKGLSPDYQNGGHKREDDRGSLRYLTILDGGINHEEALAKTENSTETNTAKPLEEKASEQV